MLKAFPKTCELLENLLPGAVAMAKFGVLGPSWQSDITALVSSISYHSFPLIVTPVKSYLPI